MDTTRTNRGTTTRGYRLKKPIYATVLLVLVLALALGLSSVALGAVTVEGTPEAFTFASTTSNAVTTTDYTTGTGDNRLLLVGVSYNSGSSNRAISSVTFTPAAGGDAVSLTEVRSQYVQITSPVSGYRNAAVWGLVNPPSGVAGTVKVTFSGSITTGIVVGAASFAGVDQTETITNWLDNDAVSTSGSTPSVDLTGLAGDELVFDTVFVGGNPPPDLTVDAIQTERWQDQVGNAGGAASTEQVTTGSVTMSWLASKAGPWVAIAVAIPPAATTTPLTVTFTAADRAYDGTTDATITGASLTGVLGGDDVGVSYAAATADFDTPDVGTGKEVTATGFTLTGTDADNYTINAVNPASADITAKALTVTGASAEGKDYDGTTDATVDFTGASLNGIVGTEDVTLDTSAYTASFADKTAGTDKAVTVSGVALAGADAGNYTVTQPIGLLADIAVRNLTVTATAEDKVYDGTTDATVQLSSEDIVTGDTVSLNYADADFENVGPGTGITVTVTGISLSGDDAGNYACNATATTTADITAASAGVTFEGVATPGTSTGSSVSFTHTTGTGSDRLMLVGISANSDSTARTLESVTFTPTGESAINLTEVILRQRSGQNRYSAIYSLLNPPSGVTGTVTVTFSGTVSAGLVAGAANFAGVNQADPLGTPGGADDNSTEPSVTLSGLSGSELIFDNVFMGAQDSTQNLTVGAGQTQLWNDFAGNTRAAASTEEALGSSVTMSSTATIDARHWVIVAVPINPAVAGPTYDLTMDVDPAAGGTTDPAGGPHPYAEGTVVDITATPAVGYEFVSWTGDVAVSTEAATTVTMDEDQTVTANFALKTYTLTYLAGTGGSISGTTPQSVTHGSSGSAVTAVPDTDYQFVDWSDGLTDNPRTDTNVTADVNVTANFALTSEPTSITLEYTGPADPVGGEDTMFVTVTVLDASDDPVEGANLGFIFDAISGVGIIDTPPVRGIDLVTDVNGQATFDWTEGLGEYGETQCYAFWDENNSGALDAGETVLSNTITITILRATRTITASAGTGGSIDPSGAVSVYYNANQSFTIAPATGYEIEDVLVDGVSQGALGTYQFTSVTADHTIEASFKTTSTPVPVLTFTSPSGLARLDSDEDTLTVGWSSDIDLDVGEFGIWARSSAGAWQSLGILETNPADDMLTYQAVGVSLAGVPAGWYQVIIGYRPTLGSGSWTAFATSYGYAFSVDDAPEPELQITAPVGQQELTSTDTFTATWTADPSVTTGQFAVWVRSPGNDWYWMSPVVPATGATSYSAPVDLSGVNPGLGYQVIVAYEPIAYTGFWMSWATSPGVFAVDEVTPVITVSSPQGIESYETADSVTASWTTDQDLTGGEFGVWVRSADGMGWYVTTLVGATGITGTVYNALLPLATLPDGLGYQVIVAYRPVVDAGAWMSWSTSPGNFSVNVEPPTLNVTAPIAGDSYTQGTSMAVRWETSALTTGEYGVWLHDGTSWYFRQFLEASGDDDPVVTVLLDVPPATTYQAVVAYRPNVGVGDWVSWAANPGTFTVVAD